MTRRARPFWFTQLWWQVLIGWEHVREYFFGRTS